MPSTYTTRLRAEKQGTGENSGTWGTKLNTLIQEVLEEAIAGVAGITIVDADYTLSTANGSSDEARRAVIRAGGTLTAARNVICPTSEKLYLVHNNTTGGYSIVFKTLAGTGITIPNGKRRLVWCDGTNVLDQFNDLPAGVTINGATIYIAGGTDVSLADGGTGASLTDPGADRILFWDDSAGSSAWLEAGSGLAITDTTLAVSSDLQTYNSNPLTAAELGQLQNIGANTLGATQWAALASATGNFGTAAFAAVGTSGDALGKLNTANTISAAQTLDDGGNSSDIFIIRGAVPTLNLFEDDASANSGYWRWQVSGGNLVLQARTDANGFGSNPLIVSRSGTTVSNFEFASTTVYMPAGSSSAPGISSSGDQNSGIELAGSDVVYMVTGATRRFAVYSNGAYGASSSSGGQFLSANGSVSFPGMSFAAEFACGYYRIGSNNIAMSINGIKSVDYSQTAVEITQGDLRINASASARATNSAGYMGYGAINTKTDSFTFAITEIGRLMQMNAATSKTATIPTNASVAFPISNTAFPVENIGAGTLVIAPDTGVTLYNPTGASGSITLNQHHGGVLYKVDTNTWRYRGTHA